jgi:hypothetical protein
MFDKQYLQLCLSQANLAVNLTTTDQPHRPLSSTLACFLIPCQDHFLLAKLSAAWQGHLVE